jgi:hypothetical protein
MEALDRLAHLVVAPGTGRTPAGIGKWDRQLAADRLDTQVSAMDVDERRHHLPWRSSSAIAKYAETLPRISLARRNSLTSRSRSLRQSRSLAAYAIFPAIEVIAAHFDG